VDYYYYYYYYYYYFINIIHETYEKDHKTLLTYELSVFVKYFKKMLKIMQLISKHIQMLTDEHEYRTIKS